MARMKTKSVSLSLPFNLGKAEFVPNTVEQQAAWVLYVELSTRIATQPFDSRSGLMRQVLDSLYSFFGTTRQILRDSGPEVANGPESLGPLAIQVLTKGIAPFTTKWHQRLLTYEQTRPPNVSALDYERSWEQRRRMQSELKKLQAEMLGYAAALAKIAGIG